MQSLLKGIQSNLKVKTDQYSIDNLIFKFHYRFTTTLLFMLTLLITSQELIGEHIKCIADKGVPEKVLERFCYFTSTFTVVKYLDEDMIRSHEVAHPGVGAMGINADEPIKRHAYYQWVPFVLFWQALMFYVPHFIWKKKEGGRLKKLIAGLEYASFATETELAIGDKKTPTKSSIERKLVDLKVAFLEHLIVNRSWTFWLIACEVCNLINLVSQIYLTHLFLGRQFLTLGTTIIHEGLSSNVDILDVVFPKMTKCVFHKYGPSGTIQSHDSLCVMALNIINEKVYAFLWFWYLILLVVSVLALVWRGLTVVLHSRSKKFNQYVFGYHCPGKINPWKVLSVTRYCSYMDWLFLVYMAKNMDGLVFNEFFTKIAEELTPITPYPDNEEPLYAPLNKCESKFD